MGRTLDLSGNPLGLKGTLAVGEKLGSSYFQPFVVDLSGCKLTTKGSGLSNADTLNVNLPTSDEVIRQQLCQMPQNTITTLTLDDNSFRGDGIHILAGFIHLCPSLKALSSCITSDDLSVLLKELTQLKSLYLLVVVVN